MKSSKVKIRLIFDTFIYLVLLAYLIYFWSDSASGRCYTFTKYGSGEFIDFAQSPIKFIMAVSIKSAFLIVILYFGFKDLYNRLQVSNKKRAKDNVEKEGGVD